MENADGNSGFRQVGDNIAAGTGDTGQVDVEVALPLRVNAEYTLQSCNDNGCVDSSTVSVSDNLATSVGYIKATNTGVEDCFGYAIAVSGDGKTLAVGANYVP